MRIAVVSDIHGNLPALEAVVEDFKRAGVDEVVNLGDSLSGPLLPRETAQYLMETDWFHLAGNHERQVLTLPPERTGPSDAYARSQLTEPQMSWIRQQRPVHRLDADILLCHGSPGSDLTHLLMTPIAGGFRPSTADEVEARLEGAKDARVICCGHSHVPAAVRSRSGQLVVNPGSVGLQAYEDDHPFIYKVENGSPDARYAILEERKGL
ncbi:MAG TPA: metallophosphoesterase family protein, partial [Myxococcales bacterium]|nr:metallophosphoesterase family protein [Myxococcales bacterium]